jgi:CDP-glycerol glycerophosphotransferase
VLIAYHSFEGHYSDNPRALHEALCRAGGAHEHVWLSCPEHRHAFPDSVRTVTYGSPEGREAVEAADLLIANSHTEFEWTKRAGTTYLQTWHGTPLKRIHWDVLWAPEGRLERLQRDVDRWDRLISPNRASTDILRGAFHYDRELLETGYPRNDVLSRPERDDVRARVRDELGIADGTTAVLYTPTWRDDVVFPEGGKPFEIGLDVNGFADALGADHCLLLRLHYMLKDRLEAPSHPSVRDVCTWPEVSELYLAADVLVTDYSSTMFDFAVTGRPMLFLTPDLEDYATRLRGFYFDFEAEAPGPLLRSTAELVTALGDLPRLRGSYAERYERFRSRFCHLEDGHAAERVLAAIPGLGA